MLSSQVDQAVEAERGWLDLSILRWITHPGLCAAFPGYLIGLYHAMHCAGAVMQAALAGSRALASECAVAARLVPYWTQHIVDETGHDQWLLEDLHYVGLDAERVAATIPPPEIAELLGTLHFWIAHTHPVAALAYFFVVERNPPTLPYLEQLVAGNIPRPALRTFYRHATIDVEHGRELEELVDTLPLTDAHRELFQLSAVTVVRQLARIMDGHVRRADALTATLSSRGQGT